VRFEGSFAMETDSATAEDLVEAWQADPDSAADALAEGIASAIDGVDAEDVDVYNVELISDDTSTRLRRLMGEGEEEEEEEEEPTERALQTTTSLSIYYVIHVLQSEANQTNLTAQTIAEGISSGSGTVAMTDALTAKAAELGLASNVTIVSTSGASPDVDLVEEVDVPLVTSTTTVTTTVTTPTPQDDEESEGLLAAVANGNLIAIAVGGVCLLLCCLAVVRHVCCRRKRTQTSGGPADDGPGPRAAGDEQPPAEQDDVTFILWDLDLDAARPPGRQVDTNV